MKSWKRTLILAAAGALLVFCFLAPLLFEPTKAVTCESVRVTGIHRAGRQRSEYFIVESVTAPSRRWLVFTYHAAFPRDYLGPATLLLSKGRWTGTIHPKLVTDCPQSMQRHLTRR
jgi:hypothetical protein